MRSEEFFQLFIQVLQEGRGVDVLAQGENVVDSEFHEDLQSVDLQSSKGLECGGLLLWAESAREDGLLADVAD